MSRQAGDQGRPGPARAIRLAWQPRPADWAEVFQARNRSTRLRQKVALVAGAFVAVALVGLGLGNLSLISGGVAGALGAVGMIMLQPRFVRLFWNRTPSARAATTAVIDSAAGITVENVSGRSLVTWPEVGLVMETDHVFVVHVAGSKAYFPLAKRGVSEPADVDRLRALLLR